MYKNYGFCFSIPLNWFLPQDPSKLQALQSAAAAAPAAAEAAPAAAKEAVKEEEPEEESDDDMGFGLFD